MQLVLSAQDQQGPFPQIGLSEIRSKWNGFLSLLFGRCVFSWFLPDPRLAWLIKWCRWTTRCLGPDWVCRQSCTSLACSKNLLDKILISPPAHLSKMVAVFYHWPQTSKHKLQCPQFPLLYYCIVTYIEHIDKRRMLASLSPLSLVWVCLSLSLSGSVWCLLVM